MFQHCWRLSATIVVGMSMLFAGQAFLGAGTPPKKPGAKKAVPIAKKAPGVRLSAAPKKPARGQPGKAKTTAGAGKKAGSKPVKPAQAADYTEIFHEWPKPKVALVLTGDLLGYMEPCGCAGLGNQNGGLKRRHGMLKKLAADGWNPVALDVGGMVRIDEVGLPKSADRQNDLKLEAILAALANMGYRAMTLGPSDLKGDLGMVVSSCIEINAREQTRIVAANVDVYENQSTPPYYVFEQAGLKIGVAAVLGDKMQAHLQAGDDIKLTPALKALQQIVPELKKEKCDVTVLLSHASPEDSAKLAKAVTDFEFQFVVTAGGGDEPPRELRAIPGTRSHLVEVGRKGGYAVVVGLFGDQKPPVRYQAVPLDSRWEDSPEMLQAMVEYQAKLQREGWAGLKLTSQPHAQADLLGEFVGSAACQTCHESAYETWAATPHAHATETLEKLTPPRHFDPECVSCHVTGWRPQASAPLVSGYDSLESTPRLVGNGCENCHGPGGKHVEAENGADAALQASLREALHLTLEGARNICINCHDGDNDPNFNDPDKNGNDRFESEHWRKIAH